MTGATFPCWPAGHGYAFVEFARLHGDFAIVSAAALIMFTIFAAFTTLNLSAVKPIAVSFAVGVLVDAFLVRLTLIPAAMAIIRAKLWYHPQWFSRYVPDPDIEGAQLEKRLAERRVPAGTPGSGGT